MDKKPPVLSPVDYDAWARGYLPPSEHVLIDALSFRGARVVCSAAYSKENQWWFVVNGKLTPEARKLASKTLHMQMEFLEEAAPESKPVTGFFALLTPEQLAAAMAYTGADNIGDPNLLTSAEAKPRVAPLNADDGPGRTS